MKQAKLLTSRSTLGVRDVAASIAFYRDAFGFSLQTSIGEPPEFAVLIRDRVSLGLVSSANPAVANFACCYINVEGVESLHQACVRANAKIANPLTRQPWGNYDFVVEDLDGHRLAFGEAPHANH